MEKIFEKIPKKSEKYVDTALYKCYYTKAVGKTAEPRKRAREKSEKKHLTKASGCGKMKTLRESRGVPCKLNNVSEQTPEKGLRFMRMNEFF